VYSNELAQTTQDLWESMVGLDLSEAEPSQGLGAAGLAASVMIAGPRPATIRVSCGEPLARHVAASLWRTDAQAVTPKQVSDALCEVANILGGSLKVLFPQPASLSLPTHSEWQSDPEVLQGNLIGRATFESRGQPLRVEIWETPASAA
jgi:hypothetical protein